MLRGYASGVFFGVCGRVNGWMCGQAVGSIEKYSGLGGMGGWVQWVAGSGQYSVGRRNTHTRGKHTLKHTPVQYAPRGCAFLR